MEHRRLGKSGLEISEIGLGGNNFGMRLDEQESIAVIQYALDAGINFIDSAEGYGQGRSEEFVGKAVKGRRAEAIIATKFSSPSRQHIIKAVEASLKRLDTDYIDLYYVHFPDAAVPIEETLRTLDSLVKSGKVRYIACSNFASWQLCESLWTSRANHLEPFVAVQSQYNLLERGIEEELVPCCESYGIGIIPYSPLAGGFLTGKYERGKPAPAGTRYGTMQAAPPPNSTRMPRMSMPAAGRRRAMSGFRSILSESNFNKLDMWQKFAQDHGHTIEELAIAWLLSHSYIKSVIAGATKREQVIAHVAAAELKLSSQDLAEVNQLTESIAV
jgi:aryl-alcohol dehydrogenase-like predicted oxidoreductase